MMADWHTDVISARTNELPVDCCASKLAWGQTGKYHNLVQYGILIGQSCKGCESFSDNGQIQLIKSTEPGYRKN